MFYPWLLPASYTWNRELLSMERTGEIGQLSFYDVYLTFSHPFERFACGRTDSLLWMRNQWISFFFNLNVFTNSTNFLKNRESNHLRAASLHCILNLTDTSNSLSRVRAAGWDKEVLRYQHNTCGQTICKCQGAWSIGSSILTTTSEEWSVWGGHAFTLCLEI